MKFLLRFLGLLFATGTTLLEQDRWQCRPCRVLLWSTESGPIKIAKDIQSMLHAKIRMLPAGQESREPEIRRLFRNNFVLETRSLPDLGTAAGVAEVVRRVRDEGTRLVILDPLNHAVASLAKDLASAPVASPSAAQKAHHRAAPICRPIRNAMPHASAAMTAENRLAR